jgi:hypothetical protein
MTATLELYETEQVDVALLEALSDNHPAIALYKKYGYVIEEDLTLLRADDFDLIFRVSGNYTVRRVDLPEVGKLHFYNALAPRQCQWQSLFQARGEAYVVYDREPAPVGYALFKRNFDAGGKVCSVILYQCEIIPGRDDAPDIAAHILNRVFDAPPGRVRCSTHDFRKSNQVVVELLTESGFKTFIEQVHMVKR